MPKSITHEEITARFLESGAVNFEALGAFVSKNGSDMSTDDDGLHGVIFGTFNQMSCFLRIDDLHRIFSALGGLTQLADAVNVESR